ncbi:MobC family plasmid mobilization relaxosome protein [Streptomyces boninensis]|uniref:MobC family plasmid mobilization relaxosome protein n=1 Tax=Streptomyces boninensis TaxID=2039455 RepID=UPI003B21C9D9
MAGEADSLGATGLQDAAEDGHIPGDKLTPPRRDASDDAAASERAEQSDPTPAFRDPELPPLPARLNRHRTGQVRDMRITARFAADEHVDVEAAAGRHSLTPAGFVGYSAVAYARAGLNPIAVLFPQQATLDRLEGLTEQLRRIGNNLNQLTIAAHTGEIPERAADVLTTISALRHRAYQVMDEVGATQPGGAVGGERRGA